MTADPWQAPETRAVALFKLIERNADALMLPSYSVAVADALLSAGWRPPPRHIDNLSDLDQLPPGTVLRTRGGTIWVVGTNRRGGHGLLDAEIIWTPP